MQFMNRESIEIVEVKSAEDFVAGKALIEEYAATLGIDLCFQNFSEEIASLAEIYGPPNPIFLMILSLSI